jgi:hypothetical protein
MNCNFKDEIEIFNIDTEAAALTDKIIKHFRSQCDGHGYYYIEQEWYINKIIKDHLTEIADRDVD